MDQLFLSLVVSICAILAVTYWTFSWGLSLSFFRSLRSYHIPEPYDESKARKRAAQAEAQIQKQMNQAGIDYQKKSKKAKKEEWERQQADVQLAEARNLAMVQLPISVIQSNEFFFDFEKLVIAFVLLMSSVVVNEVTYYAFNWPRSGLTPFLALYALCTSVYTLFKISTHLTTSSTDRNLSLSIGLIAFLLSFTFLTLTPRHLTSFSIQTFATTIGPTISTILNSKYPSLAPSLPTLNLDQLLIELALAIYTGIHSALLLPSIIRSAQCYYLATTPSQPPAPPTTFSPLAQTTLHLTLLLPALSTALEIKPLSPAPYQHHLPTAKPILFILQALVTIAVVRPLTQAHLNKALNIWYSGKHAHTGSAPNPKVIAGLRLNIERINLYYLKAALQVFAPALALLALGSMLWLGEVGTSAEYMQEGGGSLKLTPLVLYPLMGFVAWWQVLCYAAFTCVVGVMHRLGMGLV